MGNYLQGMYTGLYYYCFKIDTTPGQGGLVPAQQYANKVNDLIDEAVAANAQDSIVSLVYFPFDYTGEEDQILSTPVIPATGLNPVGYDFTFARPRRIGGYIPRNQKLLSFPYSFFTVSTMDQAKELRYEWFNYSDSENPTFTLKTFSSITANPEIACVPTEYKSVIGPNWQEEIVLSGFPQLAYTIDSYRAWVAQHATSTFLTQTGSAAALGWGLATAVTGGGAAIPAAVAGGIGLASSVTSMIRDQKRGDAVHGSQSGSVETASHAKSFYFMNSHVTEEYAKMLDDYFDRFGYACYRVNTPNLHARARYTYVQTRNAAVSGNIPAEDQRQIEAILNRGVTFWSDTANVGNYSLGNEVIS